MTGSSHLFHELLDARHAARRFFVGRLGSLRGATILVSSAVQFLTGGHRDLRSLGWLVYFSVLKFQIEQSNRKRV